MFRFRLGSIPVTVHFSHLLVAGLIGYDFVASGRGIARWPYSALEDPGSGMQTIGLAVALAVGVIVISVLFHELGHALVSRVFGYAPEITLVGLGGNTRPNAPGPIPWTRDVALTVAGPLFGLALGVGARLAQQQFHGRSDVLDFALGSAAVANIWWAALNLLPVLPLDGGRISGAILTRVFGRRGFLVAQAIALVTCAVVILFAARTQDIFLALFFGMFAVRAVSLIARYLRGEDQAVSPEKAQQLARAVGLYQSGRLGEAETIAARLLEESEASGIVRSKAHHLLGWIALKDGRGREALDHFSQVDRIPVEKAALAAAFSLVGDEHRALALWELAYRESPNPTVLHEWAGTLIREGRLADAQKLPQVDLAAAYRCAERVAFIRGDFALAAQMGEQALAERPDATMAYDVACAFARSGNASDAMRLLRQAQQLGFHDRSYAESDSDLASLHGRPEFSSWLSSLPARSTIH